MNLRNLEYMLSRRSLLKRTAGFAGLAAAAGWLNGCAPAAPGGAPAGQTSQELLDIYTLIPAFFIEMGMSAATDLHNEQLAAEGKRIVVEESPDGWETKALAMIRENNIRWSASGYAQFDWQWNYIQQGLCQPIDDLLAASSIPWAQDYANSFYHPGIYETTRFEGKTYFVPMKLNIFMAGYRQDYLEAVGYDRLPETWDEFELLLGKLKETLAEDDVVPFAVRKDIFRTLGIAFTTFIEKPYDDDNMLKINSEEFRECVRMFKRWFDAGYTNVQLMQDPMPDWQLGKVAIGFDSHSWIRLGRSVLGNEKIHGSLLPKVNASDPHRAWIHVDSSFVFAGAPYPQEGLDWLLSILGPEGAPADRHWSGTLTLSGMPVHQTQIDRLLGTDTTTPELSAVYEAVPHSQLVPMEAGKYLPIINTKLMPWLERYWGGEVELDQAMQSAMDEINTELDKQLA